MHSAFQSAFAVEDKDLWCGRGGSAWNKLYIGSRYFRTKRRVLPLCRISETFVGIEPHIAKLIAA